MCSKWSKTGRSASKLAQKRVKNGSKGVKMGQKVPIRANEGVRKGQNEGEEGEGKKVMNGLLAHPFSCENGLVHPFRERVD